MTLSLTQKISVPAFAVVFASTSAFAQEAPPPIVPDTAPAVTVPGLPPPSDPLTAELQGSFAFGMDAQKSTPEGAGAATTSANKTSINLTGSYLYLMDQFAIGPEVQLVWDSTTTKTGDVESGRISSLKPRLGALAKYNFADMNTETLVPFALVGAGFSGSIGSTKDTTAGTSQDTNALGYYLRAGGGVQYFLRRNIALSPMINYTFSTATSDTEKTTISSNDFGFSLGFSTFL